MKKYIQYMLIALMAVVVCSCSGKSSAIGKLESFHKELTEKSDDYSAADWAKAGTKFTNILKDLEKYENDLTPEELEKVTELSTECAEEIAGGMGGAAIDGLNAVGNLMNSVDNLDESVNNAVGALDNMFGGNEE